MNMKQFLVKSGDGVLILLFPLRCFALLVLFARLPAVFDIVSTCRVTGIMYSPVLPACLFCTRRAILGPEGTWRSMVWRKISMKIAKNTANKKDNKIWEKTECDLSMDFYPPVLSKRGNSQLAIENGPFLVDIPTKSGDCPWL